MSASIWLAHITVYDPNISTTKTLYFSSAAYTSGTVNLPSGGLSHTYYDPRIKQPANMRTDVFKSATTFGASSIGYGVMELVNIDGGIDDFIDYGIDGRPISIILGSVTQGTTPVWTTIFTGTMEQPEVSWDKVSIRIKDRQFELDVPLNPNAYAGTNSLPNGLEGVATDLKGKAKPRVLGVVYNIAPPMVNTARLIYQVNDGAIYSVDAVYDRGAALTKGSDYTSQSDMETNAPSAGNFRVWPAGGYFRLGSTPAGTITADVTQSSSSANMTVAQLIKSTVLAYTTITSGSIDSASVTSLDIANSAVVGLYSDSGSMDLTTGTVTGAMTVKDACDALSNSINAWYGFDSLGVLHMKQFISPVAPETALITNNDIISIDRIASNDPGRGLAAWKVRYNYKKFYTVQDSDLAGTVTAARREELKNTFRSIEVSDSSIKTKHLLATTLSFESLMIDASAASTEATRLLNIYKVDRSVYDIRIAYDLDLVTGITLGSTIKLQLNRFGMSSGKYFMVIGIKPDYRLKMVDLTVWG